MTTPPDHLHTLACPTCGAPLELNLDEPVTRCQYCGATVENPAQHPTQPAEPQVVIQMERPTYNPALERRTGGARCINFVIALAIITGVLVGLVAVLLPLLAKSGLIPNLRLQVYTPALVLKTENAAPNVIASTYNADTEDRSLARLDMVSHKVLWSAMAQKDSLQIDALRAGDTLAYVVIQDHLRAMQLSDGKQAWEASLPDKLPGACDACVVLQKGQVVVLTTDGSLGAYDALTGNQNWEKRFDITGRTLYDLGNAVGLTYTIPHGSALELYDAATGAEVTHIAPTCGDPDGMTDNMEFYSNLVFDLASQPAKVYTLYGLFNACVQRWDLASGTLDWTYIEPEQNLDNSNTTPVLLADGVLYYVQDDTLRSLDAASGTQAKTLENTQDYSLVPLLASGQRLLVRATRTRGSTRYELWGYDLGSGKNLWKRPLPNSSPVDPPDAMIGLIDTDESGWTYQATPGGLWLITFQTQPNQVTLAEVSLDTGELSSPQSLPLGFDASTDFYTIPKRIASTGAGAWFAIESRIYMLDDQAGKFIYRWP